MKNDVAKLANSMQINIDDKDELKQLAKAYSLLPLHISIKSLDSEILLLNASATNQLGYASMDDVINNRPTDHEAHCLVRQLAHQFIDEDQYVIKEAQSMQILGYYSYCHHQHEKLGVFLGSKKPLFGAQNQVNAILCNFSEISSLNLTLINFTYALHQYDEYRYYHKRGQNSYRIEPMYSGTTMSERQSELLFYLLRGYSVRDIADKLNLSKRTIESYLTEIKNKFNCHSKKDVIEKAIDAGLLHIIPSTVLPKGCH